MKRTLLLLLLALALPCPAEKSIEIDKSKHRLMIMENGKPLQTFSCAIGKGKNDKKERMGDNRTPEGEYRIVAVNKKSEFHIFLHLSYPNPVDIENGHSKGLIGDSLYKAMKADCANGRLPSQTTALGGNVGIHGLKKGWGWIGRLHTLVDWTRGCIALTDGQIEEIASHIGIGTKVLIKP
jgi:murein L,D-transpeptidase YafK